MWKYMFFVVVIAVFYFIAKDSYFFWNGLPGAAEIHSKNVRGCERELADVKRIPIVGGGYFNAEKSGSLFPHLTFRDGKCVADFLEGAFWWNGLDALPEHQMLAKGVEPPNSWRYFNVAARLYTHRMNSCVGCGSPSVDRRMGLKDTYWPEALTVQLKNYPGLEIWLSAPPPSKKNEFRVNAFIISDWRNSDGTPRVITCSGLNSNSSKLVERGVDTKSLLELNKAELEALDFKGLNFSCLVDLWDFEFLGGDARVSFGGDALRESANALRAINIYLSRSFIEGNYK